MSFWLPSEVGRSDTKGWSSQTQYDSAKLCLRWEGSAGTGLSWALWAKLFPVPVVFPQLLIFTRTISR